MKLIMMQQDTTWAIDDIMTYKEPNGNHMQLKTVYDRPEVL